MKKPLVRIATPAQVKRFGKVGLIHTTKHMGEFLKDEGYNLGRFPLEHYLVHFFYTPHPPLNPVQDGRIYNTIIEFGSSYEGAIHPFGIVSFSKSLKELREVTELYLKDRSDLEPPYTALTYPQAFKKMAGVFEDLGCVVKRIERDRKQTIISFS